MFIYNKNNVINKLMINFLYNIIYNLLFVEKKYISIHTRMKKYINNSNENTIGNYLIISIKCKNIKIHSDLSSHYILFRTHCINLYKKFNPKCIYTCRNEIHLVFLQYNKNIIQFLTTIASYTTKLFNECFIGNYCIINDKKEVLNYLIWKQLNCINNTKEDSKYKFGLLLVKDIILEENIHQNYFMLKKINNNIYITKEKQSGINSDYVKKKLYISHYIKLSLNFDNNLNFIC